MHKFQKNRQPSFWDIKLKGYHLKSRAQLTAVNWAMNTTITHDKILLIIVYATLFLVVFFRHQYVADFLVYL